MASKSKVGECESPSGLVPRYNPTGEGLDEKFAFQTGGRKA